MCAAEAVHRKEIRNPSRVSGFLGRRKDARFALLVV